MSNSTRLEPTKLCVFNTAQRAGHCDGVRSHQRGAALVTSLMILFVLTLLGITSMQDTTLEEKMAGNMRNANIAFQKTESCLSIVFNDGDAMTDGDDKAFDIPIGTGLTQDIYEVDVDFEKRGSPLRGSGYSALNFDQLHNKTVCSDKELGPDNAKVDLSQGLSQIVPKVK